MSQSPRRRTVALIFAVLLVIVVLLLVRCQRPRLAPPAPVAATAPAATPAAKPAVPAPGTPEPAEILTRATLDFAPQVNAGTAFTVKWTGPGNPKDYITIVRADAAASVYGNYRDTRTGNPVDLLAPIGTGNWEVRYVAARSHTVLARAPLVVTANAVTFQAPAEVIAGNSVSVTWTGPNNPGDYVTLVPVTLPNGQYGNYANTSKGSPLTVTAPISPGDAELRYVTGQGAKVLQRFPIRVVAAVIDLSAPPAAIVGAKVSVTWAGPNNPGDYITIVPQSLPDGQYAGYANTDRGSPVAVVAPKTTGLAEIRYMSGQGAKVLARRPLLLTP